MNRRITLAVPALTLEAAKRFARKREVKPSVVVNEARKKSTVRN